MLRRTPLSFRLRPRAISHTPPPLSRRQGDFKCHNCNTKWQSRHVWVTKLTHKCYQGENCEACGAMNRPYYIGSLEKDDFFDPHRTPHVAGRYKSTAKGEQRKLHSKRTSQFVRGRDRPT